MPNISKWMDEGETRILQILFGTQPVDGTLYLGLYKNSAEPSEDDVLADMQEPSGYGYSRKALTRGTWVVSGDGATYPELTFLAAGGDWGDVWGYFITTSSTGTGGKLLSIEHLASKLTIMDGKGIKIVPKITAL